MGNTTAAAQQQRLQQTEKDDRETDREELEKRATREGARALFYARTYISLSVVYVVQFIIITSHHIVCTYIFVDPNLGVQQYS